MKKKALALAVTVLMAISMTACGGSQSDSSSGSSSSGSAKATSSASSAGEVTESASSVSSASTGTAEGGEKTDVQVFIAASLNTVMTDLADQYMEQHPDVNIVLTADSSGKLMQQIEEGYSCDLFFSAAQKQMDQLETDNLVVSGTRHNVLNNQLVVLTYKDSGTAVTGLENLKDAKSIALADGSVPVGKYTRQALMNLGILAKTDDPSTYTTQQVSEALGGVEISEQGNVSKVLEAVKEHSCEVGTTYYSDTYGFEDEVEVLQTVSYDVSGDIIYPIAQITNQEASGEETEAAADFENFVLSDESKTVFQKYYFDTNVSDS